MYKLFFPFLVILFVSCSQEEEVKTNESIEITFQRTVTSDHNPDVNGIDTIMVTIDGNLSKEYNLYDFNHSILNAETKEKTFYYIGINSDTCYNILSDTIDYKMQELQGKKEILGYACKKAIFTSVKDTITAYYTDELSGNFTFRPGLKINGTILEMYLPDQFGYKNNWKAVSIDNHSKTMINYPVGYYNDEDEDYLKRRTEFWEESSKSLKLLEVGQPAPIFSSRDIYGELIDLEKLKGKVVVLNFWFVSCTGCVAEMPELNKIKEQFRDKDVEFISIVSNSKNDILKFLRKKEFNFKHISEGGLLCVKYGVTGSPTSIIIDKEGNISKLYYFMMVEPHIGYDNFVEAISDELNK